VARQALFGDRVPAHWTFEEAIPGIIKQPQWTANQRKSGLTNEQE
jgi:hypothetical protein